MNKAITCLLIENDPDDQEIFMLAFKEAFPRAGCWIANNCSQALERMKRRFAPVPDYIFMDWNLPLMGVEECIKKLKEAGLHNVCIFVVSGTAPPLNLEKMRQLGITKVLQKQPSITIFAREIRDVIASEWSE